jgi:hypothetical protein
MLLSLVLLKEKVSAIELARQEALQSVIISNLNAGKRDWHW